MLQNAPFVKKRRTSESWEGWFFSYGLLSDRLALRLFRLFPLASVELSKVANLRQRSKRDITRLANDALRFPHRCWYWPHPLFMGRPGFDHAPYVITTTRGTHIYLRLKHGFHYRLRTAINDARLARSEQPSP